MDFTSFIVHIAPRGNRGPVSLPVATAQGVADLIEHQRTHLRVARKDISVEGVVAVDIKSAIAGSPEVAA